MIQLLRPSAVTPASLHFGCLQKERCVYTLYGSPTEFETSVFYTALPFVMDCRVGPGSEASLGGTLALTGIIVG